MCGRSSRHDIPASISRSFHNARYAETNNVVSLSLALDRMTYDEDVLLIECDLLFDVELLRRLVRAPMGNVALVDRFRSGMDGTVVAVDEGIITHVFPPHLQGPDFSYGDKFKTLNIYRFDRDFCRATLQPLLSCYANFIDGNCYYELVLGMLVNMQRQRIAAEIVDGSYWTEVDDPNDLAVARFHFEPGTAARAAGSRLRRTLEFRSRRLRLHAERVLSDRRDARSVSARRCRRCCGAMVPRRVSSTRRWDIFFAVRPIDSRCCTAPRRRFHGWPVSWERARCWCRPRPSVSTRAPFRARVRIPTRPASISNA
jgi:hypothetical protein